jgi:hypothetical protein
VSVLEARFKVGVAGLVQALNSEDSVLTTLVPWRLAYTLNTYWVLAVSDVRWKVLEV